MRIARGGTRSRDSFLSFHPLATTSPLLVGRGIVKRRWTTGFLEASPIVNWPIMES